MAEEPGIAYKRFLSDVKRIQEPYMSNTWIKKYEAALRRADLDTFQKLPFLALPINPDYIRL